MSIYALFRLGIVSESLNTAQGEDFSGSPRAGWRAPYPERRKYPVRLPQEPALGHADAAVRRIRLWANRLFHHAKRRLPGAASNDSRPARTPI